jgi:hypothetical protein
MSHSLGIAAAAFAGALAGPWLRARILAHAIPYGRNPRTCCPACRRPITIPVWRARLPTNGRCPACRRRIGPAPGLVETVTSLTLAVLAWSSPNPAEEYRDLTPQEWDEFLSHFELRKVELGICTRDFGTPCIHEHACIRCPALRPDPAQQPRLQHILDNLRDRLAEAEQQGWRGEVAGLQVSIASAQQKLTTMAALASRHQVTHLGMPDFRPAAGRTITGNLS